MDACGHKTFTLVVNGYKNIPLFKRRFQMENIELRYS